MPDIRFARIAAALVLLPGAAHAHMPVPGIQGFYLGLMHPLSNYPQLLALLALGVLLGLAWPRLYGPSLAAFAAMTLAGMLAGLLGAAPGWSTLPLLVLALVSSALAALVPQGLGPVHLGIAAIGGALAGIASTPDPGPFQATMMTLSGSLVGLILTVFVLSGGVALIGQSLDRHWVQVGLRILAAWISAIAVLMAALSMAGGA